MIKIYINATSHASIVYRIIGSVWQESTPSKETTGPAQTRKAKHYENEQSEIPNRLEPTSYSPQAQAKACLSLISNSDCCYHRLSVATSLRSYSYQRPLAEKAAGWICKFALAKKGLRELRNNRWLARTDVGPTSSKQVLTAHLLNDAIRWIYPLACRP